MAGTYRSGLKRKPHGLRVLHGSKNRAQHRREPTYQLGEPPRPAHLAADPLALATWDVLVARLTTVGVLMVSHGEALTVLAEAWADYVRCREQLARTGWQIVVTDESGLPKEHPLIRRSERLGLFLQRYLGEFGLTPVTGGRVAARLPDGEGDALDHLLRRVR
jgi:P27 family predicted phage terminase small subunit